MAPQQVEKIEFAPGNGMVPEAANPQDVVRGARLTVRGSARMTRLQKLQKKAPKALKSLDAKLKSPPETQGELVGGGIVREGLEPGEPPSSSNPHGARRPNVVQRRLEGGRKAASGDKRFGESTLTVWEACNPLKSHKTAKAFFGKAWTKTA
jgi:hypothetical protein